MKVRLTSVRLTPPTLERLRAALGLGNGAAPFPIVHLGTATSDDGGRLLLEDADGGEVCSGTNWRAYSAARACTSWCCPCAAADKGQWPQPERVYVARVREELTQTRRFLEQSHDVRGQCITLYKLADLERELGNLDERLPRK